MGKKGKDNKSEDYFGDGGARTARPPSKAEVDLAREAADTHNGKLPDINAHPLAHAIPRDDRVIVKKDNKKSQTDGGILLPDSAKHSKPSGTVHRVGPGKRHPQTGERIPLDLQAGDRVLLTDYAGLEIRDPMAARASDDEYVILRDEDIIAKLPR